MILCVCVRLRDQKTRTGRIEVDQMNRGSGVVHGFYERGNLPRQAYAPTAGIR